MQELSGIKEDQDQADPEHRCEIGSRGILIGDYYPQRGSLIKNKSNESNYI